MNVHQRVTLAEENFRNQVDEVTPSVNISLFPQPNKLMNEMTKVTEMEVMPGFSMDFHSPRPLLSVQLASSRHQQWILIWLHSSGWSASYLVASYLHWIAFIMEAAAFCSDWTRPSKVDFPSLHTMCLPKLSSTNLQSALSTGVSFYTALLLVKEFISQ